jgi:hypothetical protein
VCFCSEYQHGLVSEYVNLHAAAESDQPAQGLVVDASLEAQNGDVAAAAGSATRIEDVGQPNVERCCEVCDEIHQASWLCVQCDEAMCAMVRTVH